MRISRIEIILVAIITTISFGGSCQDLTAPVDNSPVLLDFGAGGKVTKAAFEQVYQMNNGGLDSVKLHTPQHYRTYLGQYIDFYRKVMEAEDIGLHKTDEFKSEYESTRRQLAKPYLVDHETQESLILEAYERSKWLVSCSHLLVSVGPSAPPEDTIKAYNTAKLYLDSILKGSDFAEMTKLHSNDPSAVENAGYLGYFSVFDMVYPFETGAYTTAVGNISIVRSDFGYHLIKVHNKVKNEGKKTAAHIIVRVGPEFSAKDNASAAAKIEEIYQELKAGLDFSEAAKKWSDDPTTANRGGDLGNGRLVPVMEEVRRGLPLDKFSVPFQTDFGWHILKVTHIDSVASLEDTRAELVSRISKDARSYRGQENLIERVKQKHGFKFYPEARDKFNSYVKDLDEYKKGRWRPSERIEKALNEQLVFEIGQGEWHIKRTLKDYYDFYFRYRKQLEATTISGVTDKYMKEFISEEVVAFQGSHLAELYPEYARQLKEYRDGILIFTLTEKNVWQKAAEDAKGQHNYFERHKENFKANDRVIVREYRASKPELLEAVERMLSAGKTANEIDSISNAFSPTNVRIRLITFEEGKTIEKIDLINKPVGSQSPIMKMENGYGILVVEQSLPAEFLTFDEAKNEVIAGYQTYLEEWWLIELETKYPVTINDEVLNTLFK